MRYRQNEPAIAVDANHNNIVVAGSNDEIDEQACSSQFPASPCLSPRGRCLGRVLLLRLGQVVGPADVQLDRYLRARAKHPLAGRPELWLGANGRGPLTATGIYQLVVRRGEQAGVAVHPQRFRHHFSHTWLARGGAGGDLMQLNGWSCPQMLTWYGASAAGARARSNYDRIMNNPR